MPKPKAQTITQILVGDTLANMASRVIAENDPEQKMILIVSCSKGLRFTCSKNVTMPELLGLLYLSIDKLGQTIYESEK